jgi:hypothetical protein
MSLREEVWVHITYLSPSHFIEVPVPRIAQKERSVNGF